MANHLFESLQVRHSTTASYHRQCNSQAELFNKIIAQYLSTAVNEDTTDWELYVPALAFAYNTSFHCFIQTTPFSLTFGIEARLPAFFAPDMQRLHGDTASDDLLARLQYARQLVVMSNLVATDQQKAYFDKSATHHDYHEGQLVLMEDFALLNKNKKLAPKFLGPFKILSVKGPHNVELLLTNGRKIVINITRIKPYFSSSNLRPSGDLHSGPASNTPPPVICLRSLSLILACLVALAHLQKKFCHLLPPFCF